MRIVTSALAALALAASVSAQESPTPPPGLAALETERSRACVDVLEELDRLDRELEPLAARSQRLLAVAEAVALEDERILGELDQDDPIESRVHDWFLADQERAQRYVATLSPQISTERAAAREEIQQVLADALAAVQAQAQERMAATGDLAQRAAPCDGAIFVRGAVQEACAGRTTPLCEAATRPPGQTGAFRFVDEPAEIWEVSELRPWTNPTPLRPSATGQLEGARTVVFARNGNVVLSVSFSPLLRDRTALAPDESARISSINDSLGIHFEHPELAFSPALGIRATLPQPLADESQYLLHFGAPDAADILWTGEAGTGSPLEAAVPIGAAHVDKLGAGEPIALTAVRPAGDGSYQSLYTIELTSVNQARASQALLGYMTEQLGRDLARLVQPRGGA